MLGFKSLLVRGLLLASVLQASFHAAPAKALIIAAATHDPISRENLCCAGICFLFLLPPVGIILGQNDDVDSDFDTKLPFLSQTDEGRLLKKKIAQQTRKKDRNYVTRLADGNYGVKLKESSVRKILKRGQYSKDLVEQAVEVLCTDGNG